MKSTNYVNTFIEVAEDCPAAKGEAPPVRGAPTVARLQFEMLIDSPYKYTSDDVLFHVYASRNNIPQKDLRQARIEFFSKGQACFRSSPLTKRYAWGVHCDAAGRMAISAVESEQHARLASDPNLKHLKGMRTKRA